MFSRLALYHCELGEDGGGPEDKQSLMVVGCVDERERAQHRVGPSTRQEYNITGRGKTKPGPTREAVAKS